MSTRSMRTSKRILAAIAAAGIAATTVAITSPASAAQTVTESRVFGADRYATAAAVATATFTSGTNNLILASGENYPDGLSASGLAGFANAPVLLTTTNALPSSTAGAIATLDGLAAGKATVHIIGGESAVGPAVRSQLTSLGYTLNEISGANRYDTSAAVATFAAANLGSIGQFNGLRTAIVATGTGFADALSAGAPAFAGRHPILLTAPTALPTSVGTALKAISAQQVIVLGGPSAVSEDVVTQIKALGISSVIRLGGADRYATAKLIADTVIDPTGFNFYGTAPQETVLVSGVNFADALGAGPHAGTIKAPMLLVQPCVLPPSTKAFHTENSAVIDVVRAIGGTAAICDQVLKDAVAAATVVTPTATLVAEQGRNYIDVTFSEAMSAATFIATDLAVASPGRVATIGAPATYPTAGLTNSTTFRVPVTFTPLPDIGLKAGDSVVLAAGSVQTPTLPARSNAAASVTVAADTVRPTAKLVPAINANYFYVVFSEPMGTSATVATNYTATVAPTSVTQVNPTTFQVFTGATNLVVGNSIGVLGAGTPPTATGALDLAGNPVVPNSISIAPDTLNPFMQSATVTNVATAQAVFTNNKFTISAVKGGPADGAVANGFSFVFTDVDGAATTISGPTALGVITFRGDFSNAGNTLATSTLEVANVWNANPVLKASATIGILNPTMDGVNAMALTTPGQSSSTVVVQFNEAVTGIAGGDILVYSSNAAGASLIPFASTTPAVAIDGKVTLAQTGITNPLLLPKAGTAAANTPVGGISDLAGNLNVSPAQTVTIN